MSANSATALVRQAHIRRFAADPGDYFLACSRWYALSRLSMPASPICCSQSSSWVCRSPRSARSRVRLVSRLAPRDGPPAVLLLVLQYQALTRQQPAGDNYRESLLWAADLISAPTQRLPDQFGAHQTRPRRLSGYSAVRCQPESCRKNPDRVRLVLSRGREPQRGR
jgi:hypothetical protein